MQQPVQWHHNSIMLQKLSMTPFRTKHVVLVPSFNLWINMILIRFAQDNQTSMYVDNTQSAAGKNLKIAMKACQLAKQADI